MIVDQGLSSGSNIGTAIVAARTLKPQEFGAFGLAFTVYVLSIGIIRALVTEPLVSLYSSADADSLRPTIRAAVGSAIGLGCVASILVGAGAFTIGGPSLQALGALAMVLPALVLQDAWRYCFVAAGRPRAAALNDAIWCATQALGLLVILSRGHLTLFGVVLWWGGSGALAGVIGCLQEPALPALSSTWRWVHDHSHLSGRYAAEYAVASGSSQLILLVLPAIAGLAALATIRGAQLFFGPLVVVFGGTYLALGAEGARLRTNPHRLRRLLVLSSAALFVIAGVILLVAVAVPISLGRDLFGDTWNTARHVIVPVGIGVLGGCVTSGAIVGLRALAAAPASLRARLQTAPLAIGAPILGALDGARGFAIGVAIATWFGSAVWWHHFNRALAADVLATTQSVAANGT